MAAWSLSPVEWAALAGVAVVLLVIDLVLGRR